MFAGSPEVWTLAHEQEELWKGISGRTARATHHAENLKTRGISRANAWHPSSTRRRRSDETRSRCCSPSFGCSGFDCRAPLASRMGLSLEQPNSSGNWPSPSWWPLPQDKQDNKTDQLRTARTKVGSFRTRTESSDASRNISANQTVRFAYPSATRRADIRRVTT